MAGKTTKGRAVGKASSGNRYGMPEVLRGLTAVAYAAGNYHQAVRDLKEDGIKIDRKTLARWVKDDYADDYERIRTEIIPKVGQEAASEHMALARKLIERADEFADRLKQDGKSLEIRDVSKSLRDVSTGAGIHTDKARLLQGDFETPHKERRDLSATLRELKEMGVTIDGTAEEIDVESPELPRDSEEAATRLGDR